MTAVRVARAGRERLPDLEPVFASLHRHHRAVVPASIPLTADEAAWPARRATYEAWLAAGTAVLLVAEDDAGVAGYAFTILHAASDDTFPLAPRYAELYTLAVLPDRRGRGIGSALLDAVDAVVDERGATALTVSVMAANDAAIRLYRRRGLVPGELLLYRFR